MKIKPAAKATAWRWFSLYVRLSQQDKLGNIRCYTCDKEKPLEELQAGHAIGGRHDSVLFNELLVRPQCIYCNDNGKGMYHIFIPKLIREYGLSLEWWEDMVIQSKRLVRHRESDWREIAEYYRLEVKRIKG